MLPPSSRSHVLSQLHAMAGNDQVATAEIGAHRRYISEAANSQLFDDVIIEGPSIRPDTADVPIWAHYILGPCPEETTIVDHHFALSKPQLDGRDKAIHAAVVRSTVEELSSGGLIPFPLAWQALCDAIQSNQGRLKPRQLLTGVERRLRVVNNLVVQYSTLLLPTVLIASSERILGDVDNALEASSEQVVDANPTAIAQNLALSIYYQMRPSQIMTLSAYRNTGLNN
jgi:hypothetical protein